MAQFRHIDDSFVIYRILTDSRDPGSVRGQYMWEL